MDTEVVTVWGEDDDRTIEDVADAIVVSPPFAERVMMRLANGDVIESDGGRWRRASPTRASPEQVTIRMAFRHDPLKSDVGRSSDSKNAQEQQGAARNASH